MGIQVFKDSSIFPVTIFAKIICNLISNDYYCSCEEVATGPFVFNMWGFTLSFVSLAEIV